MNNKNTYIHWGGGTAVLLPMNIDNTIINRKGVRNI